MKKSQFKHFGPFSYFRVKKGRKNFFSGWLTRFEDYSFGWEWGTDDTESNPSYCLRIGHFNVFSYERFKAGFTVFLLGFWYTA